MKTDFKTRYRRNKDILEWLDAVALAVVTVALLSTFCARLVRVDGISMNPGLLDGQRLLITRLLTPDYGDIVVTDSRIDYGKPLIKRVIGKAGDTIDIDFAAGITMHKKLGDYVKAGESICTFYADDESLFAAAEEMYRGGLIIRDEPPTLPPLVYARVTSDGVERF